MNTDDNPADSATMPSQVASLTDSTWIHGPDQTPILDSIDSHESFPFVSPDEDKELRPEVDVLSIKITSGTRLGSHRFERFSPWIRLVKALEVLLHVGHSFICKCQCKG